MGELWTDEMEAEHTSQQASEPDPPVSSSVWIKDTDLLFRDLLRGALAHLLAVVRHRVLRGPVAPGHGKSTGVLGLAGCPRGLRASTGYGLRAARRPHGL